MRVIVVGLGIQGRKRRAFAGADFVATVDPFNPEADHRAIEDVQPGAYDAAMCCIPDEPKFETLARLLRAGKHVLVEKPLWADDPRRLAELQRVARETGAVCYTAYNHRFEPHFMAMRDLLASGELGRVYAVRLFYGNGTARLVRESRWRDAGAGVLPDLGSHLLDTCRFWFPDLSDGFRVVSADCFENRAPDHVVIGNTDGAMRIQLEMTLLSWRNHFTCDVFAENGSAHIESLCKWGPSTFTRRTRVLPSGMPPEERTALVQSDPTWAAEYAHFKRLCAARVPADLSTDFWLQTTLDRLAGEVSGARHVKRGEA